MSKSKKNTKSILPDETIIRKIYVIREQKLMPVRPGHPGGLDFDLAVLYEVETKALNQAVKRNMDRFPEDLCFGLQLKNG